MANDYDEHLSHMLAGDPVTVPAKDADAFAETLVRVGVRFQRVDYERGDTAFALFRLTPDAVGRAFLAPDTETGPTE